MANNGPYISSTQVASSTPFDNSTNGFTATDVQAAIEEAPHRPSVLISDTNIDWSLSNTFYKTLSANTTFTFSNTTDAQKIVVAITNTASNYTVTWPTLLWSYSVIPVHTIGAKTDIYTFIKIQTILYGSVIQSFV